MNTSIIKHLVICGGGPTGFLTYGAAKFLSQKKVWNINEIETIYGTSIGAYMGLLFALKYDWETLDDYIIKRPWEKVANIQAKDYFSVFTEKGLVPNDFIKETLRPLIEAKDLSIDVTLKEFYDYSQIEIHMYTVDLNQIPLSSIDLSYKTHPDLSLVKAIQMTTCFPIVFRPICDGNACYIDGGLLNNYPLRTCLEQTECDSSEILGFRNIIERRHESEGFKDDNKIEGITKESSLFDYIVFLMKQMARTIDTVKDQPDIENSVDCTLYYREGGYNNWIDSLIVRENRENMIQEGMEFGRLFYEKKLSNGKDETHVKKAETMKAETMKAECV